MAQPQIMTPIRNLSNNVGLINGQVAKMLGKSNREPDVDFRTIEYVLGKTVIDESIAYANSNQDRVVRWLAFYNPIGNTETLQNRKQYLTEMALGTTPGTEAHDTRPWTGIPGITKYQWYTEKKRPGLASYSVLVIHAASGDAFARLKSQEFNAATTPESYTGPANDTLNPSSDEERSVIQRLIFICKSRDFIKNRLDTVYVWNVDDPSYIATFGISNGDPISKFPMTFYYFNTSELDQFLSQSIEVERIAEERDEVFRIDKEQHSLTEYLINRKDTFREEWGHVRLTDESKRTEVEASMAINGTAAEKDGCGYFMWARDGNDYFYTERWNTLASRQAHTGSQGSVDWYPESSNLTPSPEFGAVFGYVMDGTLTFIGIKIHNTDIITNHSRVLLVYPTNGQETVVKNLQAKTSALEMDVQFYVANY